MKCVSRLKHYEAAQLYYVIEFFACQGFVRKCSELSIEWNNDKEKNVRKKKSWNIISLQFLWSEMNIRDDVSIDYNNYNDDNIDNGMRTIILIKEWKWMLLGHFDFFLRAHL